MAKMWAGRTEGVLDKTADDFNSSISFDGKMFRQDILGSMAHAAMLAAQGIISQSDADELTDGLQGILDDLEAGVLCIDSAAEDIHMFIEAELTARKGEVGKRLHTARSRNDQVALDLRMYLREEGGKIKAKLHGLLCAITVQAQAHTADIMPGYTHLQRAQPITLAQHLLAYAQMFLRDSERLTDALARMNYSPLGCCALAGTTYPIDRQAVAKALGFAGATRNSLDGVSDRDFCVELLSAFSLIMVHLSRFCEEIILWTSWEFRFAELSDAYTTGSSIMPQKKNSDMAELIRGKSGRVFGDLMSMLTVLKGLPLAYNKDMQEDKEAIFDGVETVGKCLDVFTPMLETMKFNSENMLAAAKRGFINATDLADYLTKKGVPFRTAYKIVGQLVAECVQSGRVLEELSLEEYQAKSELFSNDLYNEIALSTCVARRDSYGGTSFKAVDEQIQYLLTRLKQ